MRLSIIIIPILFFLLPNVFTKQEVIVDKVIELDENYDVSKMLVTLGDTLNWNVNTSIKGVSAQKGYDIIHTGFVENVKGKKQKKQSKHFVCTSCHNMDKEDPDLISNDPQARLEYTNDVGLPFLQGTTLWGAVSRRTFYNGDYVKKYGDLVYPARNNIREAIQLCAVECAQGRALDDWEIESVLAYLQTIDIKVKDLQLSAEEKATIKEGLNGGSSKKKEALFTLQSKYLPGSPATFLDPNEERKIYEELTGDPANGNLIYQNSCLHCHENKRYSYFDLDNTKMTFKYLKNRVDGYSDQSIYQAIRFGIYSVSGRRSYMPHYTLEKMSKQQLVDLRSFIVSKS